MALQRVDGVPAGAEAEPTVSEGAILDGTPIEQLPNNLYIPPHALRVLLESFEGPLDLLLYLVRRRNLDILRVNLLEIAEQYISYIDLMERMQVDLAAEYLVMAATLTEIKLRMLLPQPAVLEEDGDEVSAAALVRRLRAYERIRAGAQALEGLPREGRDFQLAHVTPPPLPSRLAPAPTPLELSRVMVAMLREGRQQYHRLIGVQLSVRERMGNLLSRLVSRRFISWARLLVSSERSRGVVVNFLAVLELLREQSIEVVQMQSFGPIYLRSGGGDARGGDGKQAA